MPVLSDRKRSPNELGWAGVDRASKPSPTESASLPRRAAAVSLSAVRSMAAKSTRAVTAFARAGSEVFAAAELAPAPSPAQADQPA